MALEPTNSPPPNLADRSEDKAGHAFIRYVLPPAVPWVALIASLIILVIAFDDAKHVGDVLRVFAPSAGLASVGIGIGIGVGARRST
jgi:hypothetical protein